MLAKSLIHTDFYELTMMQGYYLKHNNPNVVFDMYFRRQPFGGGFTIFAGLDDLLDVLEQSRFSPQDIDYLKGLDTFTDDFLDYLDGFTFSGDVYAMDEGTVVFPGEPLIRVHSTLLEAQLLESLLLNIINFQTLVATKTARIVHATRGGKVLEFGLRRAHGPDGALSAARAAYIGGASATSNTLAGKLLDIPVKGTMAHSWVMAFRSELEAFKAYAELYPDSTILLIDTYDTLSSGLPNAIEVGKELKKQGRSFGVRLDSGDLHYLSCRVRAMLDEAGLEDAVIAASNELDEQIIHQLVTSGSPIDIWGVGTKLVTGRGDPALTGVYKLCARQDHGSYQPTIKVSDNIEKMTNPGVKQVYRYYDTAGAPQADLMAEWEEAISPEAEQTFYHPVYPYKHFVSRNHTRVKPLLEKKIENGKRVAPKRNLNEVQEYSSNDLKSFDDTIKRIINPYIYKVSLSEKLKDVKFEMVEEYSSKGYFKPYW
jgi:nicotinate phosphoribosyltransferase